MFRKVLRSKIHRATVTHADLHYEGSITIPPDLLSVSGIAEYEAVAVWNVTQGTRFETYAIGGVPETGEGCRTICVNGAAAHLVAPGDLVIVACFQFLPDEQVAEHKPQLVFVNEKNEIAEIRSEIPGPELRSREYPIKAEYV